MTTIDKEQATPVYLQLGRMLREKILSGTFVPGERLPSENELSQKHSISRMTARAALMELNKENLASIVRGKGRFVQEEAGRTLKVPLASKPLTLTVASYPILSNEHETKFYFGGLLNGLTEELLHHHARSKFFTEEEVEHSGESLVSFMSGRGVDGVILNGHAKVLMYVKELEEAGIPVVIMNEAFPDTDIDYVVCNHRKGTHQLMEYLIQLGHRRIACLSTPMDNLSTKERWAGYREVFHQHGLPIHQELFLRIEDLKNQHAIEEEVVRKLGTLRKSKHWPTAIFAAGGAFVMPALHYLQNEGLTVPQDMSVVAFDEVHIPSTWPALTHVRQPLEKMARRAVNDLIRKIQRPGMPKNQTILDPEFILGESCANVTST